MKVLLYALVIASFMFLSVGATQASDANIVPNASLENSAESNQGEPDFWFPDYWGKLSPTFAYPVAGHAGQGARVTVRNYANGDAKWFFVPQVAVSGHMYVFSDYYLSTASSSVIVQFTMSSGSYKYMAIGTAPRSTSWRQFTKKFVAPAAAVKVSVFHRLTSNGSLTVDDYLLMDVDMPQPLPLPPPPSNIIPTPPFPHNHLSIVSSNLISNPSFEDGADTDPDFWFRDWWGINRSILTYPVAGRANTRAVKISMDSYTNGDAKWLFNPIPVTENADYIYSDYYLSTVKTAVIVQFTLLSNAKRYMILDVVPPASVWTKIEQTFNAPPDTVAASVLHVITGVGSLTIDDVALYALAPGIFSQGMVSLSFDDNDLSFLSNAKPILDAAGLRASLNVPINFIGSEQKMNRDQLKGINSEGYEIDSHSIGHPFLTNLSFANASAEIIQSLRQLLSLGLSPVTTFAYPFGDYNDDIEAIVRTSGYTAARGTTPGFNTKNTDIFALHTQNVEIDTPVDQVKEWIDQAMANKTWLILGFHEIGDGSDTYDYPPESFRAIVDYLNSSGARVVTTNTALKEMR